MSWFRRLRHDQSGQGYIEFMLVLPLFLLTIAGLILFGRVLYVKLALDMTTYDACRAAVEAMDQTDGIAQGNAAGRNTLHGFFLNAGAVRLAILPQGAWGRGTRVMCQARFNLYVGDIPLAGTISGSGNVNLEASSWSRIETWRSYWR
ncbi:MAG: pilus assembly protein [Anaerolineae bacterium]|nr:pilus assembly protein [Anaerolineae bacterium]